MRGFALQTSHEESGGPLVRLVGFAHSALLQGLLRDSVPGSSPRQRERKGNLFVPLPTVSHFPLVKVYPHGELIQFSCLPVV